MAAWEQTGRQPAMLADAPAMPAGCATLWGNFLELSHCRGATQAGPLPITFLDMDAWQRVRRVALEPWEIEAIRRCDMAFLKTLGKRDG